MRLQPTLSDLLIPPPHPSLSPYLHPRFWYWVSERLKAQGGNECGIIQMERKEKPGHSLFYQEVGLAAGMGQEVSDGEESLGMCHRALYQNDEQPWHPNSGPWCPVLLQHSTSMAEVPALKVPQRATGIFPIPIPEKVLLGVNGSGDHWEEEGSDVMGLGDAQPLLPSSCSPLAVVSASLRSSASSAAWAASGSSPRWGSMRVPLCQAAALLPAGISWPPFASLRSWTRWRRGVRSPWL